MAVIEKKTSTRNSTESYSEASLFDGIKYSNGSTNYFYPGEHYIQINDRFAGVSSSNPCCFNNVKEGSTFAYDIGRYDSYDVFSGFTFSNENGVECIPYVRTPGTVIYQCKRLTLDDTLTTTYITASPIYNETKGWVTNQFDTDIYKKLEISQNTNLQQFKVISFKRADSTFNTDTYPAQNFIDNTLPKRLLIELQAAGGGASAGAWNAGGLGGSGGGGGGYAMIVLYTQAGYTWKIELGNKGSGGPDSGEDGSPAENINLYLNNNKLVYVEGGKAGTSGGGGAGGKVWQWDNTQSDFVLVTEGAWTNGTPIYDLNNNLVGCILMCIYGGKGGNGSTTIPQDGTGTSAFTINLSNVRQLIDRGGTSGGTGMGNQGAGGASAYYRGADVSVESWYDTRNGRSGAGGSGGDDGGDPGSKKGGSGGRGYCMINVNALASNN